jgi:hypothetical protein
MNIILRELQRCCLLTIALLLLGCGGNGDRPKLGLVSGKVTLNGQPLKNVEISFIPEKGRPSYGQTDGEGNYNLDYIRNIKGAKIGKHTIHVYSGKVDNAQNKAIEIIAGNNKINVECVAKVGKAKPKSDDEAE